MRHFADTFFNNEFVYIIANKDKHVKIENIEDYKFDANNLSYIINVLQEEMETSVKNNIILNFFKYVHQYVNQHFIKRNVQKLSREDFKKLTNDQKIKYITSKKKEDSEIKELKKELMKVKNDLCLNNVNFTSNEKYHKWIISTKKIIFPTLKNDSILYEDDIKINYFNYLKHMLIMNSKLEENNKKMFSAIPLRTEITDKYITLNSSALKDIFGEVNSNISNEQIWNKYFDINLKKHKINGYSFNFQISTDGHSVSINFIKNDEIEKKNQKSKNFSNASKKTKQLLKGKSEKEVEQYKKDKKANDLEKQVENAKKLKELKAKEKEEFKKKSKEEQEKIKLELKFKKNKYEYIEDAVKNPILKEKYTETFNSKKICVVDPGMRAPMTILGNGKLNKYKKNQTGKKMEDGKILFSYSTGARLNATKRLEYARLTENKKKKTIINGKSIIEHERELSLMKSKTTKLNEFYKYCAKKFELRKYVYGDDKLVEKTKNLEEEIVKEANKYSTINDTKFIKLINNKSQIVDQENMKEYNNYLKKIKWFGYINKQRHESKLLDEIEEIYGKDSKFIFGDWSEKNNIKRISTPRMGTKKLLGRRFEILLINEFNTSKLYWKTEESTKNLRIEKTYTKKDGTVCIIEKEIYSLLTCQMSDKKYGIINRDYNATKNIYKITESIIRTGKRPKNFIYDAKKLQLE